MTKFDLQPTLNGDLLCIRPLKEEDFEHLYKVSSDPLVWEQHPERLRYQRDVFEKFFRGAMDSKGALLAMDRRTGAVIGSSRYTSYDPAKRSVEVGYTFLARRCWGQGYNTELKRLMLAHAFPHVDEVFFYIGAENRRSRNAIERIGAQLLEILEREPREGRTYSATVYILTKADYLSGPLNPLVQQEFSSVNGMTLS